MNKKMLGLVVLAASVSFTSVAKDSSNVMMQAAGAEIFKKCSACHSTDSSKNAFGPDLTGVVNRKSASLPRFAYSDALRKSGLVWTEANLRRWIAGNDILVPGTRMRHVQITDAAEQDYLLAYLKSLK
ncbi:cytochrome c family protein [Psychrobium sp. 1_MG-2023]|uniref:c-type cytochrome n=1 Tax=Psychrobium sp. 1_MG-2023 TaxID=3062624 RepID=UPI000C320268|nr:c-type cytochrome [Psychrobium sp. 1_MG-2023]MDP2560613.1 c-type cytochrome [Psychrobium sp. 1_MG-2023]PKF57598.1 cytochrome C [Alteromonadales bacterium alter-6D02]